MCEGGAAEQKHRDMSEVTEQKVFFEGGAEEQKQIDLSEGQQINI